jgi:hypothetical protein
MADEVGIRKILVLPGNKPVFQPVANNFNE